MSQHTPHLNNPPDKLVEVARAYLADVDAIVVAATDELAAAGEPVTCRRGCSWCCRLPLSATSPEVELAANYILGNFGAGDMAALMERLSGWELWRQAELPKRRGAGLDELDAFALHGPGCPFLSGGDCTVYPVRPMGCRVHNSVSDPALCRPGGYEDGGCGVPPGIPGTLGEVLEAVKPRCLEYRSALEGMGLDFAASVGPFAAQVRRLLKS